MLITRRIQSNLSLQTLPGRAARGKGDNKLYLCRFDRGGARSLVQRGPCECHGVRRTIALPRCEQTLVSSETTFRYRTYDEIVGKAEIERFRIVEVYHLLFGQVNVKSFNVCHHLLRLPPADDGKDKGCLVKNIGNGNCTGVNFSEEAPFSEATHQKSNS